MAKRLVICCDGTWNSLIGARDADGLTNVARLYLSVAPRGEDALEQRAHYVPGVGTGPFERLRGGVFGYGLSRRVKDAYRFLVDHYEPGDELWFFGFSRGAFTARSAAGLVRQASILTGENRSRVGQAYRLYRSRSDRKRPDSPASRAFREAFSHGAPRIRFIGVWDTVGALGFPSAPASPLRLLNRPWSFHDTTLSSTVDHARHAVAVDEMRGPFRPTLWRRSGRGSAEGQTLEQAWFAGVHCDVGGGYPETGLSQLALGWMMGEATALGLGLDPCLCPPDAEAAQPPPPWMIERAREMRLGGADPEAIVGGLAGLGDPLGPLHRSRKGIYRWMAPHERPIPTEDARQWEAFPGQWVSRAAADRIERDAAYAESSPRLAAYLGAGGEVRPPAPPRP